MSSAAQNSHLLLPPLPFPVDYLFLPLGTLIAQYNNSANPAFATLYTNVIAKFLHLSEKSISSIANNASVSAAGQTLHCVVGSGLTSLPPAEAMYEAN
jgi:hypothetical protein